MSFDVSPVSRKHIVVIGGGVSGLSAAYHLTPEHRVTLIEAAPRLGGHARTVMAGKHGTQPVDTGFIVFNYANYPHLTRMFSELDVPVQHSEMTFGASINNGRVEYALSSIDAIFTQRRNLANPSYLRMIRDILRFNKRAEAMVDDTMTVADLMHEMRLGSWFRDCYLLPFSGAIWSTPPEKIMEFPAKAMVDFFRNHSLLSYNEAHQWCTVKGGSAEYVRRLEAHLRRMGTEILTRAPVRGINRTADGVVVHMNGQPSITADEVVMACHPDTALSLLDAPSRLEKETLGAIRYQDNYAILHSDPALMPRRRKAWASWVYRADHSQKNYGIGVTYWMNRLQNIPEDDPLFVTLNASDRPKEHLIYDEKTFRHPVFDHAAMNAQKKIAGMQGTRRTWFAGAWTGFGFHEDGFASGYRVAQAMQEERQAQVLAA